ncbi:transporter substrate-binding domain-containing protein [Actinoplanes sp. NPDC023936]|uniref:transporter substrate-binding domain-containing protein n=1 Tax=Actinoplanes sp. NPDC023936 TaxID=3154910 RepID=UPI003409D10E
MSTRMRLLPAVLLVTALAVTGCGKPGTDTDPATGAAPGTITAGTLMIGSQQSYIPGEFRKEGGDDLVGFGVDIVTETGKRLGLTPQWVQSDYAALITGLQSRRFDMGSGGMSVNPARLEQVDMVGYYRSGATFLVRKADEGKYTTAEQMCGRKLGMLEGSTTLEKAVAALCPGNPIQIEYYTATPLGLQGLLSERVTAYAPDLAQAQYIVEQNPAEFATTGYHLVDYLINFTFAKGGDTALRDAVYRTLDEMIKDGTYAKILESWNLSTGGLTQPAYNGDLTGKP